MPGSVTELLAEAESLSGHLPHERSTELQPVKDFAGGRIILTWRADNAQPDHALHSMMSRVGSFPPALVRYFLALYSQPGDIVLDPFCGKGTALFEAAVSGRVAIGGDIGPDAVASALAKSRPVSTARVANYIEKIELSDSLVLSDVPPSVALFYRKNTLSQIVALREQLLSDMRNQSRRDLATFVCGVLLGVLHGHSRWSLSLPCNQAFGMSPNYVSRYVKEHKLIRPDRDVRKCLLNRALALLPFPEKMSKVVVVESPAQKCDEYVGQAGGKAALIITSPPYLDRQTYIKDSWLRLWFLNKSRQDVAKGSLETGSVSNFVEGMIKVMRAMSISLKKNGIVVIVCGRAMIKVAGQHRSVRISELCLLANSRLCSGGLVPERLIVDKKMMKRGAYFAVHHGKSVDGDGKYTSRFGEDEILVFRRS